MMAGHSVKRPIEEVVSLEAGGKRKKQSDSTVDYTACVICMGKSVKGLYNIQPGTKEKLLLAMSARDDETSKRLKCDVISDTWLQEKAPKWHEKCRNWYINKKGYKLAEERNLRESTHRPSLAQASCSDSSEQSTPCTRSILPTFDPKTTCVICNKIWSKHKKPTCKVSTESSQQTIIDKAKLLKRNDILHRLIGHGHDMIANDICYHKHCMDLFRANKVSSEKSGQQNLYDIAFLQLVDEIDAPLFQRSCGFMIKSLRDKYRSYLKKLGVKTFESYKTTSLISKLQHHFGKKISILNQSSGSGFLCASSVPLGDALEKLRQLETEKHEDKTQHILQQAARILQDDSKLCKKAIRDEQSTEISFAAAEKIVPDSLFNFSAMLLSGKGQKSSGQECKRMKVDQSTKEKALILSQQLLQHVSGIPTPLAIATSYHIYNQTRSKALITMTNRLGLGLNYDSLHRQLTSQSASILQQIEEEGVYIPENMTHNTQMLHVFAMDNLDWKKKTLEGGSFHATTAIVIENCENHPSAGHLTGVSVPNSSSGRRKSLSVNTKPTNNPFHISARDRQKSRSLKCIESLESLQTSSNHTAEAMLLIWKLGRTAIINSQLLALHVPLDTCLPGFSAFCARLLPHHKASKIGYLSLIPASPTNPAILKEEMLRLLKTSEALGDSWTVITGDQATYELAVAIRDKHSDIFGKVVLLLGGFHLAHNYLKAICKIIRQSGAEELIATAGLCQEGTAQKIFGDKGEYYQSMHAIKILNEAMWRLYWDAFESWSLDRDTTSWKNSIEDVLQKLLENSIPTNEQLELIRNSHHTLTVLQKQLHEFEESLDRLPTAKFWINFLQMSDILFRFIYSQREGDWMGHLCESAKMLPYLTAAGHYKYGQQSLPLYLSEMKKLPLTAPEVHMAFMNGAFIGRRADGHHNGVSPDMLLEQTYNADAKEESGLDGITLNEAARTKWVHTKPITAAISAQLKSMLHLNGTNPHHESGPTRVAKDGELVLKVIASVEMNPFISTTANLVNISTGQCAEPNVKQQLTNVKELGDKALSDSLSSDNNKTKIMKLQTFYTQNLKLKKKSKSSSPGSGKSDEVVALLRMTQIIASGGEMDIVNFIGEHECSKMPTSLFEDDGTMRRGIKSNFVKTLKEETGINCLVSLPETELKTAVVIDSMYAIHQWSFQKGETYGAIATRFKHSLLGYVTTDVHSLHFCCDNYHEQSLKIAEHKHRYSTSHPPKVFEVSENYTAPDPKEFFASSVNKAGLLNFLCEKWCEDEEHSPTVGHNLYLGGGFNEATKTVLVTEGSISEVPELASTQIEADTRVILHALYSMQNEGMERIIIHANDTDIVVMCLYYADKFFKDHSELWIKTGSESFLPIHEMAAALGPSQCRALPFIHSLSGRDTTSYPYFTGKKVWITRSKEIDISALENFAEEGHLQQITEDVVNQARQLFIAVYTNKNDELAGSDLGKVRAYKFLNNKSTLLKLLPPTEDAFHQHLLRSALATITDKSAHIPKPTIPSIEKYGWTLMDNGLPSPVPATSSAWPEHMKKKMSCGCTKGCSRNCSCAKKQIACYIGCRCQGSLEKCNRVKYTEVFTDPDSSESDSDGNDGAINNE